MQSKTGPKSLSFTEKATTNEIRSLEKEFIGRGEVKGFKFTQIQATDKAFLYEVDANGYRYYEVFRKRENTRFGRVSYPTSKSFGVWAWTCRDLERAIEKFEQLNS